MIIDNKHRGPTLDDLLKSESVYEELKALTVKEAIAWQLEQAMLERKMTKTQLADMMDTSRTQIDRLLDSQSGNITIDTLQRAANLVGRQLRIEMVA